MLLRCLSTVGATLEVLSVAGLLHVSLISTSAKAIQPPAIPGMGKDKLPPPQTPPPATPPASPPSSPPPAYNPPVSAPPPVLPPAAPPEPPATDGDGLGGLGDALNDQRNRTGAVFFDSGDPGIDVLMIGMEDCRNTRDYIWVEGITHKVLTRNDEFQGVCVYGHHLDRVCEVGYIFSDTTGTVAKCAIAESTCFVSPDDPSCGAGLPLQVNAYCYAERNYAGHEATFQWIYSPDAIVNAPPACNNDGKGETFGTFLAFNRQFKASEAPPAVSNKENNQLTRYVICNNDYDYFRVFPVPNNFKRNHGLVCPFLPMSRPPAKPVAVTHSENDNIIEFQFFAPDESYMKDDKGWPRLSGLTKKICLSDSADPNDHGKIVDCNTLAHPNCEDFAKQEEKAFCKQRQFYVGTENKLLRRQTEVGVQDLRIHFGDEVYGEGSHFSICFAVIGGSHGKVCSNYFGVSFEGHHVTISDLFKGSIGLAPSNSLGSSFEVGVQLIRHPAVDAVWESGTKVIWQGRITLPTTEVDSETKTFIEASEPAMIQRRFKGGQRHIQGATQKFINRVKRANQEVDDSVAQFSANYEHHSDRIDFDDQQTLDEDHEVQISMSIVWDYPTNINYSSLATSKIYTPEQIASLEADGRLATITGVNEGVSLQAELELTDSAVKARLNDANKRNVANLVKIYEFGAESAAELNQESNANLRNQLSMWGNIAMFPLAVVPGLGEVIMGVMVAEWTLSLAEAIDSEIPKERDAGRGTLPECNDLLTGGAIKVRSKLCINEETWGFKARNNMMMGLE